MSKPKRPSRTRHQRGCIDTCFKRGEGHPKWLHHHHSEVCLPYDVWPYSTEAQLERVQQVLGTDTVSLRYEPSVPLPPPTVVKPKWLPIDIEKFGCHKVTFEPGELARAALGLLDPEEGMSAYKCRRCRKWHHGHSQRQESVA